MLLAPWRWLTPAPASSALEVMTLQAAIRIEYLRIRWRVERVGRKLVCVGGISCHIRRVLVVIYLTVDVYFAVSVVYPVCSPYLWQSVFKWHFEALITVLPVRVLIGAPAVMYSTLIPGIINRIL